jgi:hypothetical protein
MLEAIATSTQAESGEHPIFAKISHRREIPGVG